jgi:hypothetical protein
MWRADDRRFIFVTGKGGVGKTTVSAALARALAGRGKRVLIAMCNAKERISSMFASELVGPEIVAVAERIWAVNMDPQLAFEQYGRMVLKVPGLYRVVFQNKYVRSFLPAVPGFRTGRCSARPGFTPPSATRAPRFDIVLFDAPAPDTGSTCLRVPRSSSMPFRPAFCGATPRPRGACSPIRARPRSLVVTLPEELPVTETLELIKTT